MNRVKIMFLVLVYGLTIQAQDKKEIIQKGIRIVKSYEQNIADGDKSEWLDKIEFYNVKGDIVELKEYEEKGTKIKSWFKYAYDANAFLIEETELDAKGEQKERFVYVYKNGLKVEKQYYDSKNRLYKRKKYAYEFGV